MFRAHLWYMPSVLLHFLDRLLKKRCFPLCTPITLYVNRILYCTQAAAKQSHGTNGSKPSVSGRDAFVLYDTYGFPLEITQELASAQGVTVDLEGFTQEMQVPTCICKAAVSACVRLQVQPFYLLV